MDAYGKPPPRGVKFNPSRLGYKCKLALTWNEVFTFLSDVPIFSYLCTQDLSRLPVRFLDRVRFVLRSVCRPFRQVGEG